MNFTSYNIKGEFLEFTQKKIGKITIVPIHNNIKKLLNQNKGQFPHKISDQKFNEYIKKVAEKVGFTELMFGAKINDLTKRKEKGMFPRFDLVTSHICRRSFAMNHYGKLPTPVIMSITNHTTEKSFLTYIGKTPKDHAEKLQDYWNQLKSDSDNNSDTPPKVFK